MKKNSGLCLECGKAIKGRTDKKFCCGPCKNSYHNRRRVEFTHKRDMVFTRLSANYRILQKMIEEGKDSATLEEMESSGFCPDLFTGYRKAGNGRSEYRCIDIKYFRTVSRIYRIRKME